MSIIINANLSRLYIYELAFKAIGKSSSDQQLHKVIYYTEVNGKKFAF